MNEVRCNQGVAGTLKRGFLFGQTCVWRAFVAVVVVMAAFGLVATAEAADWYVDGAVPGSGDGTTWVTAFKTIGEGITAASATDTINVAASTYDERLVIGKQLTLVGAGSDSTFVQPTDPPTAGVYDVEIDASGTIIQDFQFDFNGTDGTRPGNGIAVSDTSEPAVTDVQIQNNKIYTGNANTGLQTGEDSDVSGLVISGNIFYGDLDSMGEGIYVNTFTLSASGDVVISSNEFYGYLSSGVSVEASNVQVIGNTIDSDTTQGIYGVRFIDLTDAQTYDNVLISNNSIQNVQYGIMVGTSSDVGSTLTATIDSNTLSNNDEGVWVQYGADLIITNNNISRNTVYGINNVGTTLVVAEYNWWGDASGPYHPTTNPSGTGDEVSDNVDYDPWSLDPLPVAEFSASPTSGIAPLWVQFTDQSTGTITIYDWELGDAQTSTEQDPWHEYQNPGDYTVKLTVTGPGGSTYRGKINYVRVSYPPPVADFSANYTRIPINTDVQFTNLSTGTITGYYWEFGDTQTSTEQNPLHQYTTDGYKTVRLTVTGPGGVDVMEKTNYIEVTPGPIAEFSAGPTSGVQPLLIGFTDLSLGNITDYYWEFGDTQTSTDQDPFYWYQNAGDYTVRLTVTGPGGVDVMEKTDHIHVDHAPPVADFSASPTRVPMNMDVQFTNLSTGTITDYDWDFGDGISAEQNPLHQYSVSGYYTVRLTVTGPGGVDFMEKTDYVEVTPGPVADFSANPTSGDAPLSVQFTDLSLGTVADYYWEFGDGQTSTGQNPLHEYQNAGDYTVRLTATNPGGSDVKEIIDCIDVKEPAPVAEFIATTPTIGILYLDVQFADLSTGVVTSYYWQFGDGKTSTEQNPLHTYKITGQFTVRLTVTGPDYSDVKEKVNYVYVGQTKWWATAYGNPNTPSLDQANAVHETADGGYVVAGESKGDMCLLKLRTDRTVVWETTYGGSGNDEARAGQQTTDGGYIMAGMTESFGEGGKDVWVAKIDTDATVITWQKTYGGTLDDEARSVRQTSDGGYFVAGSTSSFGEGGSDIWVLRLDPDGDILWQKTYGGALDDNARAVQETTDDECIVAGATESFGDGSTGFPDISVFRPDQDGEINGCTNILTSDAVVSDTSVVPQDTSATVLDTSFSPSDTSVSAVDTSAILSTVCSQSAIPVASFTSDVVEGKNPLTVQFTNLSIGHITDYRWEFGDEEISTEQHPVHQFEGVGTYKVKLKARGPAGLDWEIKADYITVTWGLPIADFSADVTVGTPSFSVEFTDKSSDKWGPVTGWEWDFGDGSPHTYGPVAVHRYNDGADAWTVSLTAFGPGGSDTKTKIDYIHRPEYVPSHPVIEKIKPRSREPGQIVRIIGYNFGAFQGDSLIHINNKIWDSTKPKIKYWSDTKIRLKLKKYPCSWFRNLNLRRRKLSVTVGGTQSNIKKVRVTKPDTCP